MKPMILIKEKKAMTWISMAQQSPFFLYEKVLRRSFQRQQIRTKSKLDSKAMAMYEITFSKLDSMLPNEQMKHPFGSLSMLGEYLNYKKIYQLIDGEYPSDLEAQKADSNEIQGKAQALSFPRETVAGRLKEIPRRDQEMIDLKLLLSQSNGDQIKQKKIVAPVIEMGIARINKRFGTGTEKQILQVGSVTVFERFKSLLIIVFTFLSTLYKLALFQIYNQIITQMNFDLAYNFPIYSPFSFYPPNHYNPLLYSPLPFFFNNYEAMQETNLSIPLLYRDVITLKTDSHDKIDMFGPSSIVKRESVAEINTLSFDELPQTVKIVQDKTKDLMRPFARMLYRHFKASIENKTIVDKTLIEEIREFNKKVDQLRSKNPCKFTEMIIEFIKKISSDLGNHLKLYMYSHSFINEIQRSDSFKHWKNKMELVCFFQLFITQNKHFYKPTKFYREQFKKSN